MGDTRNLEEQRREKNGIEYFDRGTITGRDGKKYDRFAIHTHFVEVGESQAELVKRYVLPLAQPGDVYRESDGDVHRQRAHQRAGASRFLGEASCSFCRHQLHRCGHA